METQILHQKYLATGTAGHAIIRRFYSKYSDLLIKSTIADLDDVVHEVFVSLSRTNFSEIQNVEHYVMRAIKLRCWSLLDKAIRLKAGGMERLNPDEPGGYDAQKSQPEHLTELEGMELLSQVNSFKSQLNPRDFTLLNLLIDGSERADIAKHLDLNLNTLDTSIRRLRIRLAEFLRGLGYTYKALEKFDS